MKILSIVETAYRATLEEQDDTILWLNHALKNHGADVTLLLRGNAVNYLVQGQDASGLTVGARSLAHAAQPDHELAQLIRANVAVFAVENDLQERGLRRNGLIDGFEPVSRDDLPALLERFDQVWHW